MLIPALANVRLRSTAHAREMRTARQSLAALPVIAQSWTDCPSPGPAMGDGLADGCTPPGGERADHRLTPSSIPIASAIFHDNRANIPVKGHLIRGLARADHAVNCRPRYLGGIGITDDAQLTAL
ncbi:hypothetical protein J6590_036005 [Homalodisca vitripennis]|nr:hypothetical protein J6590_036005 [Homalodisca vitripennis]